MGCHPNWPQGAPVAAPLENPGLFYCALRSLAMFQVPLLQAGNLAAARCLHFGIAADGLQPLIQQAF
ncbi:hypothetical protein CKQ54_13470 [Rahnella variigena]|uniref:Uncharacterized protein n=1 Tax=Rahnella variigena TaxID=574964 RepID=A0ABX9PZ73_9GAMM|nr:hypothetical protein D6D38_24135 [Rahnella variigena]RKF69312.1 hypothetical protein CKQ54_13470 [Rahnella variigena]